MSARARVLCCCTFTQNKLPLSAVRFAWLTLQATTVLYIQIKNIDGTEWRLAATRNSGRAFPPLPPLLFWCVAWPHSQGDPLFLARGKGKEKKKVKRVPSQVRPNFSRSVLHSSDSTPLNLDSGNCTIGPHRVTGPKQT